MGNSAHCVDSRLGRIHHALDIGPGGGVHAEYPCDSGHLAGREHKPQAQEGRLRHRHQSRCQNGGLKKGGQAQARHLLAPLDEAVRIAAGHTEHIEAPHRDLDQQDPALLQIGKEYLASIRFPPFPLGRAKYSGFTG